MKHIGWCLDRIQIVMADIPKTVISHEDREKANNILDEVQECANTLAQIIQNPDFETYLGQLKDTSIEGVRLQEQEIQELFKELKHMLYILDLYILNLKEIIQKRPEEWSKKADQLVLTIHQKFGGERGELQQVFNHAVHNEAVLRKLVTSERHLNELLK